MTRWANVVRLILLVFCPPLFTEPLALASAKPPDSPIDTHVFQKLNELGITPASVCTDEVFLRRAYLDITGTLPEPDIVLQFLADTNPDKRARVIDDLLQSEAFAAYWSMKWADLLRVKSEFPINLWPNAVQAYHRWIYDSLKNNKPYDQFARELLTSSGSNLRVPPVNFYRAVQSREPASLAGAVALTFMGTRTDGWTDEQRTDMARFFSRVAYKKTKEWKEEIVFLDPKPTNVIETRFPDGTPVTIPSQLDPRMVFADWLINKDNPWFARNIVNRIWAWLLGRGIIHEPDDIRPDNPPSNPELLAYLERELIQSGYDLRHVYRLILNSRTYQQSSIPRSDHPDAEKYFACYIPRRVEAEVLADMLKWLGKPPEEYSSQIPEPYTFIPKEARTVMLADASITSSFLETFGRSPRDTGKESERNNEPTVAQRLYLLNSNDIHRMILESPRLRAIFQQSRGKNPGEVVRMLYLTILSRLPKPDELRSLQDYVRTNKLSPRDAGIDLVWALMNSKEFLYRH